MLVMLFLYIISGAYSFRKGCRNLSASLTYYQDAPSWLFMAWMLLSLYLTNLNIIKVDLFFFVIVVYNNIPRNIFFYDCVDGCRY